MKTNTNNCTHTNTNPLLSSILGVITQMKALHDNCENRLQKFDETPLDSLDYGSIDSILNDRAEKMDVFIETLFELAGVWEN